MDIDEIYNLTKIDQWFLHNIKEIVELEEEMRITVNNQNPQEKASTCLLPPELLLKAKQFGFSDQQLARLLTTDEVTIRQWRIQSGIKAVYKLVDTCGAEFEAYTPYYYSTYEKENESRG
jgi:carbamoyl-phosphate synthase large subunit